MKKIYILLLIVVAVSIGVIVAMTGDYTTYGSFALSKSESKANIERCGLFAER